MDANRNNMSVKQTQSNSTTNEAVFFRPFFLVLYGLIGLVYITSLIYTPALRQFWALILFSALTLAHALLHWQVEKLMKKAAWKWLYLIVQCGLVFAIGNMNNLNGFTLGLYMGLAGEAMGILWPSRRAIILSGVVFFAIMSVNTYMEWGQAAFLQYLPIAALMMLFVYTYVISFLRLDEERTRVHTLLCDLEVAHKKLGEYAAQVEGLTIEQERQRMARELHDTLAQGLAGLIMQLEAIDSHLENANATQAQTITRQAMGRARTALAEARRAIQDLRSAAQDNVPLADALGREIDQFTGSSGIHASYEFTAQELSIPSSLVQEMLRILREALNNIAHHSHAANVLVRLEKWGEGLRLTIQDDGDGFNPLEAGQKTGSYGLAGMHERARRMGGSLSIESAPGGGSTIRLEVKKWQTPSAF